MCEWYSKMDYCTNMDNAPQMPFSPKQISLQHIIAIVLIACILLDIIPDHKMDSLHYLFMLFTHAYFLITLHITRMNPHNLITSSYLIGTIGALYYSASIFKLIYWKIAIVFASVYKFLLNTPKILTKSYNQFEKIILSIDKLSLEVSYAFIPIP